MSVCTFFGHSDCFNLDVAVVRDAIEELIKRGITEFIVGNSGQFDDKVFYALKELKKKYPHISYSIALAYLPTGKQSDDVYNGHSFYPEGQESVLPRFAIESRNRYLIDSADVCICYVNNTFGGAYKFAHLAKRRGLQVVNLGSVDFN